MQTLEEFFIIKDNDCISNIDSSLPSLLGTYTLVKWMEIVSAKLANKNISDGFLTVGQEVCIEHKGMGKIEQKIKITSKMIESTLAPKLHLGVYTHETIKPHSKNNN